MVLDLALQRHHLLGLQELGGLLPHLVLRQGGPAAHAPLAPLLRLEERGAAGGRGPRRQVGGGAARRGAARRRQDAFHLAPGLQPERRALRTQVPRAANALRVGAELGTQVRTQRGAGFGPRREVAAARAVVLREGAHARRAQQLLVVGRRQLGGVAVLAEQLLQLLAGQAAVAGHGTGHGTGHGVGEREGDRHGRTKGEPHHAERCARPILSRLEPP
mmetsp:Transcript_37856/g.97942  ORF Transcript_37856/g.97942 Transcript_37856/m.97942 type:complete len:218 (+) Transcript_37856:499-1152(+)